jgi:MFS transporter, SP family, sugar:H+ symporter
MGIALKKPDNVAGSAAPAIIIGLFVSFGGVLFGLVTCSLGRVLVDCIPWLATPTILD